MHKIACRNQFEMKKRKKENIYSIYGVMSRVVQRKKIETDYIQKRLNICFDRNKIISLSYDEIICFE